MSAQLPAPWDAIRYDDAVAFIRLIGEELVLAGYLGGDRTQILKSLRLLVADKNRLDTLPAPAQ